MMRHTELMHTMLGGACCNPGDNDAVMAAEAIVREAARDMLDRNALL